MINEINEKNPQKRIINQTAEILKDGGIVIFPTDTVYSYGCDVSNKKAIDKLYHIKNISKSKPLSFLFSDISEISHYVRNVSNTAFKIMKSAVPGPYTFIFQASKLVPKMIINKQKTIGIRIPDNNIVLELVKALGNPILSTTVHDLAGNIIASPVKLEKLYSNQVESILDAGEKISEMSTVIDLSSGNAIVIREGKGKIFFDAEYKEVVK